MGTIPLQQRKPMDPRLMLLGVFAIIICLFISLGTYTIESGSVGVKSTFGKYSDEILRPGLHFRVPGVQNYRVLDIKIQTVNYQGGKDMPDKNGVIHKPKITVLDSKNLNIGIEITAQFMPLQSEAKEILITYGENYFEKLINPNIRDIVRNVAGQYQAEEIAVKRSAIGEEIQLRLIDKFVNQPFELYDVQIRNIELPKIIRAKIEEVQLAKQEEQRLSMIEKQAQKNQEIKIIEANTRLIEVTTQAKADAEKKKIEADAKAFQIKLEAIAIAEANHKIAESITPNLIQYESIKKWKGEYPRMLVSDKQGISMIMQLPSMD